MPKFKLPSRSETPAPKKFKLPPKMSSPPVPPKPPPPYVSPHHLSQARHDSQLSRQASVTADKAEVNVFENLTPGRSALEAACQNAGLQWGIIKLSLLAHTSVSGVPDKHTALVLIGQVRETSGEDLDAALMALAAQIEEEHGGAEEA